MSVLFLKTKIKMEERKPINPPKMWQVRNLFVDQTGEVFSRGKSVPSLRGVITEQNVNDKQAVQDAIGVSEGDLKIAMEKHLKTISKPKPKPKVTEADVMAAALQKIEELSLKVEQMEGKEPSSNRFDSTEFAEAIVKAQKESDGVAFLRNERDIDKKDFLDVGITFSSYGTGFLLNGDKRMGVYVASPYNIPFYFEYQATDRKRGNQKEETLNHFCSFTTHSKKEITWLKSHSLFNIEFWLTVNEAINADAVRVQAASKIMGTLTTQSQPTIIKRCRDEGIPIGNDVNVMRSQLANKLAGKVVQESTDQAAQRAVSAIEKEMFK